MAAFSSLDCALNVQALVNELNRSMILYLAFQHMHIQTSGLLYSRYLYVRYLEICFYLATTSSSKLKPMQDSFCKACLK